MIPPTEPKPITKGTLSCWNATAIARLLINDGHVYSPSTRNMKFIMYFWRVGESKTKEKETNLGQLYVFDKNKFDD